MGFYKPFDQETYKKNDKEAFLKVRENLTTFSLSPYHEEDYKIDSILLHKDKPIAYLEFEMKKHWKTYDFNFEDVQFMPSKLKYRDLDLPSYFVLFNADFTNCGVIDFNDIDRTKTRMVYLRTVGKEREMIWIPKDDFTFGLENLNPYFVFNLLI